MKNKNKIRPSSSKQIQKQVRLEKWEDDLENKKNNNQRKSLPNVHNEYNISFNNKKNYGTIKFIKYYMGQIRNYT